MGTQEVVPVKSEPGTAATAQATHYEAAAGQEHQVALEEQYDESYDYGQYGEAGYDDGSGMIDPNTGMPIQAADGNKDRNDEIESKMIHEPPYWTWKCSDCEFNGVKQISPPIDIPMKLYNDSWLSL